MPAIVPVAPQNEFIHFTPEVVHDSHAVEEKCVDKVEYVEELVQDEEIKRWNKFGTIMLDTIRTQENFTKRFS